jgi:amino acid permease
MLSLLTVFGRLSGIIALVLLAVALIRQLLTLVGFLLAAVKILIIVAFLTLLIVIVVTVLRDRSRRRREPEGL